jgi:hypothetical protein
MKSIVKSVLFWFAVVVAALGIYQYSSYSADARQSPQPVADFQMVVEFSDGKLNAQCLRGCAWKTLSYGCQDGRVTCKAQIDQLGVGVAR